MPSWNKPESMGLLRELYSIEDLLEKSDATLFERLQKPCSLSLSYST